MTTLQFAEELEFSPWGAGGPIGEYEFSYDLLRFKLEDSISKEYKDRIGDSIYIGAGVGVAFDYLVDLGLVAKAGIDAGTLNLSYAIELDEVVSSKEVTLNQKSYVDTANWSVGEASLSTTGIDPASAYVSLDFEARIKSKLDLTFSLEAGIDTALYTDSFAENKTFNIFDFDESGTFNLFRLDGGELSLEIPLEFAGVSLGSISAALPSMDAMSTEGFENRGDGYANLTVNGQGERFLTVTADLLGIATGLAGIPSYAISGEFSQEFGPFYAGLDYTVASAEIVTGIGLEQTFSFTPTGVAVTMTSSFGAESATNNQIVKSETVTGKLGEKFEFATPQGEGSFTVTASYVLRGSLLTKTGFYGSSTFDWSLLSASAKAGIYFDYGFGEIDESIELKVGPVLEGTVPIVSGYLFTILEETQNVKLELFTETYTISYENFYIGTEVDDVFTLTTRQISVDGFGGDDKITGNGLDNVINAGAGDDVVFGLAGNDRISGGAGDDVLDGGAGDDAMLGGAGDDLFIVDQAADSVTELAGEGTDTVRSSLNYVLGSNLENLQLVGAALLGTGNELDNAILGNVGANTLLGLGGNDLLVGGGGNDVLSGGIGNDVLVGGAGADRLDGGAGFDTASYRDSAASVTITVTNNGVTVTGDGVGDVYVGIEAYEGSAFDDILNGGTFNDTLSGLGGNDRLSGGAGADTLNGDDGDDLLDGGTGNDVLNGGAGADTLKGGVGDDMLNGGDGDDTLDGGTGVDRLNGGAGNDMLDGGLGNDVLNGGAGSDRLTGGAGNDVFLFLSAGDIGMKAGAHDIITDFQAGDKIDLAAIYAGNAGYQYRTDGARLDTADASKAFDVSSYVENNKTFVVGDTTGDGLADFAIEMNGAFKLNASNFIVTEAQWSNFSSGFDYATFHAQAMMIV